VRWLLGILVLLVGCSAATDGLDAGPIAIRPPSPSSTTELNDESNPADTSSTLSVEPIRTIHPDEWTAVIASCLRDRGVNVYIKQDGGLNFQQVPAEQQPSAQQALAECQGLYPVDEKYRGLLAPEQLSKLYEYYVGVLIPCLESRGYPGFDPPSKNSFSESYGTEDGWSPYMNVPDLDFLTQSELFDLMSSCPETPAVDFLFGD
jgi:hypothetical protein